MKKIILSICLLLTVAFFACEVKEVNPDLNNKVESLHQGLIDPSTPECAYFKSSNEQNESNLKATAANVGEYALVFSDEFNDSSLDETKWSVNYPNCCGFGSGGRTHNHRAWMAEENVNVSGGNLTITAKAERHPDAPYSVNQGGQTRVLDYQAGAINSKGKFNFTYGKMEIRAKSTRQRGTWPAFWTLNNGGEWPPEIDILEIPIKDNNAHRVHHYYYHYGPNWQNEASFGSNKNEGVDLSAAYHTYSCEWGPNYMYFYFDGNQVGSYTGRDVCKQSFKMYLLINLAVGGWGGSVTNPSAYPDNYDVDWVRVYQKRYYLIKNKHTGKCLRVQDGSTSENAQLVTYDQQNNWDSEHFCFPYIDGKRLILNRNSSRVLRPDGAQSANNTNVFLTKNENWSSQQWELVDAGDNYYFIKNVYTGKYLRPLDAQSANNTPVVTYDYNNWNSMKWELIAVN